jgi:NADH-quinone oxidoreductase subunit L
MQLALFLPLLSFLVLLFLGKRLKPLFTAYLATTTIAISLVACFSLFIHFFLTQQAVYQPFTWFVVGKFRITGDIDLDFISIILLTVTSIISLLVHIYSVNYMAEEKNYNRFFAFLGLFTFAMYGLLLTDNLLVIYVFWELVGACSYLLISFWHEKETAIKAAKKAFLINRFGDIGFFVGIALLWFQYKTLNLNELAIAILPNDELVYWASLGLVLAACAKSAQLPFSMWLPDAMEAPTPVSALLHAATMVAAGAYLLIRIDFLFNADIQSLLLLIGSVSTLSAAITACYQTEMKKILAFSTISQLGLMFIAVGLGMPELAFFHLLTHAFFKANLFLSVGFLSKYEDKKLNKLVFIAYTISATSLAGLPFTSGFLSKELILYSLELQAKTSNSIVLDIALLCFIFTSFCTAYYITRQALLLWLQIRNMADKPNTSLFSKHLLVAFPIFVLAVLSLFFPFASSPFEAEFFVQNAQITYKFDIFIFGIAMIVLFAGSASAWLLCYYRHCDLPKQYIPIRLLNKLYETLTIRFALSAFSMTSSVAYHQNYFITIGNFIRSLAKHAANFDTHQIDGGIHFTAIFSVTSANVLAWFDKNITDGLVKSSVYVANIFANRIKKLQNGKIQWYLFLLIFLSIIIGVVMYIM